MNIFIFLMSLLVAFYNIICLIKVLIEQYYSFKRLIKCQISFFFDKKIKYLVITGFYIVFLLIFYFLKFDFILIFLILINYLFIMKISLKNYHFTRRNILLLSLTIIIYVISSYFIFFKFNKLFYVIFSLILSEFSIFIAFLLLLPIEKYIRHYYIKKAHNKIIKNKYFIIGITGSFGKTTTKNFIYSFLKTKYVISSQNHNYNTLIGLAKYINNEVSDEDEILIVELGVDQKNSMIKFKKLFSLDIAIVNSIGEMHLSTFKSLDNIIKEKLAIRYLLKETGSLFINENIVENYNNYLSFDFETYSLNDIDYAENCFYKIKYFNQEIPTYLITRFQLESLAVALKIARKLKLNDYEIIFSLNHLIIPQRRLNVIQKNNLLIVDNSYNANLNGIKEIINNLLTLNKKIIVVTGGLIELGNKYYEYNYLLGDELNKCEKVILISKERKHPLIDYFSNNDKLIIYNNLNKAYEYLLNLKEPYLVLLLSKGSDIYLK